MLIGKENVINWLDFNKTPFWRIKSGSGENAGIIFNCQRGDENVSLEDGKQRLENCLSQMAPGNYFIEAWNTLEQKKGWNKTSFQITTTGMATQHQQSYVGGHGAQDINALITQALEKERNANKIERLEADVVAKDKRIKELESEINSVSHRVSGRLEQVISGFLGNGQMQPANNQSIAEIGNIEDDGQRIGALMEKWAERDPQFETVLKGIVNLAYNNPGKYSMGKSMLK